ncbi:ABC transporter permease [Ectobacillus ponti]|uniref:ABC transporter permease n=1 Tax=Ectobacillus ponti TaxID=2961894 RepID=A0AA42BSL4_9BACI|nr:ABC transporter permease [Ectobacillus ponti]MCP8970659.1 ABC transporter permease [Ectobacillus ponti]
MQSKAIKQQRPLAFPSKIGWQDYVVYIFFAIVLVFFSAVIGDSGFLTLTNMFNIVRATAMIAIMAIAMTFVISSGELDLSVGSTTALSALVSALVMKAGYSMFAGVAAGLISGLVVGSINGFFVTVIGIPSFLVTLGMMQFIRGFDMWITLTDPVPVTNETFNNIFGSGNLGTIPSLLVWAVLVTAVGHVTLKYTPFGRQVLSTGGNRMAAEYSGINTKKVKFITFLLSGLAASTAGMLYTGMMQTARFNFGTGAELLAIAAVILGGTSMFGGKGTIIGTLVGALLIGMINNGLIIMGLDVSQQMMVAGAIIILAVSFGKKPTI